jgi:hypothetical protein
LTVCFVLASSSGEGGSVAVTETAPRRRAASAAATSSAACRSFMARRPRCDGLRGDDAVATVLRSSVTAAGVRSGRTAPRRQKHAEAVRADLKSRGASGCSAPMPSDAAQVGKRMWTLASADGCWVVRREAFCSTACALLLQQNGFFPFDSRDWSPRRPRILAPQQTAWHQVHIHSLLSPRPPPRRRPPLSPRPRRGPPPCPRAPPRRPSSGRPSPRLWW